MGKVLGVQRWGPVFVSLAEIVAFVPVTSALWCGNRRVPAACCPTSLAKLVSSRFSKVCFRKQRNRESERWPMPTISLHTHKFTCAHMYTYSINRHTSHTQIEMADSDKEGDYVTMAKTSPRCDSHFTQNQAKWNFSFEMEFHHGAQAGLGAWKPCLSDF